MNPLRISAEAIIENLYAADLDVSAEVVVFSPTIFFCFVKEKIRKTIAVGAQNLSYKNQGAFTGETAADQLIDCGAQWVLIGHSERRTIINEDDDTIARKTENALKHGFGVILCIGEYLKIREEGRTIAWVARLSQKRFLIGLISEPIWAIGTGNVATSQQAQEVHAEIRKWLAKSAGKEIADKTRIIYGGSANGKNSKSLADNLDIDGFLVGGESLKPEFFEIINVFKH